MRFIRKNGRIIPIADKKEKSGGYGTTAALGYAAGLTNKVSAAAITLGSAAKNIKAVKFGTGLMGASAVLGVGSIIRSVSKGMAEKDRTKGIKEFAKHYGSSVAGNLAGQATFIGFAKYKIAKGLAMRSTANAAKNIKKLK